MSRLRLVDDETHAPLRKQVTQIITDHKAEVIETVRRWIVYGVQMGAWELDLDNCPTVTPRDYDYVIDWLRTQGISVHRPPGRNHAIINLRPEAHPGGRPRKRSWF